MELLINSLIKIRCILFDFKETQKGSRTLVKESGTNNPQHYYKIKLSDGSYINIYCKEIKYTLKYSSWWARDKPVYLYKVWADLFPDNARNISEDIKKIFKDRTLCITNLWHPYSMTESKKKAAIQGFLDIMLIENNR